MATTERMERTRTGRPKLRRTDDVLYHWAERIDLIAPEREHFSYSSMICEGDRLFHYGHHFELARILRDRRGRARLVLLNGDSYGGASGFGPSTASRQSDVRRVARLSPNVPSMVVPFSALEAGRVSFDTIRPIHVRDDRQTIEEHSSRTRPAKLTTMEDPSGATKTEMRRGYHPTQLATDGNHATEWCEREITFPLHVPNPNRTVSFHANHGWCEQGAERGDDGVWRWTVRRHWLGDCIFRARCIEDRTRKATADEMADHQAFLDWTAEHRRLESIRHEHWAAVRELDPHTRYQLSAHDGNYRLMTRRMFAAQGFRERGDQADEVLQAHRETQVWANGVRDSRMPITVNRWATFLSSFDYQESRPLYFLCELPHGAKPSTVDEAVEALKPPEVLAAEARGLAVVRQGDLFAIPTKLTKRQVRRLRGVFTKRLRVLGTNHSVTEGAICKGGAVLGRGIMRHEPDGWRQPDHAQRKLGDGKTWHLLVRNTVPQSH